MTSRWTSPEAMTTAHAVRAGLRLQQLRQHNDRVESCQQLTEDTRRMAACRSGLGIDVAGRRVVR